MDCAEEKLVLVRIGVALISSMIRNILVQSAQHPAKVQITVRKHTCLFTFCSSVAIFHLLSWPRFSDGFCNFRRLQQFLLLVLHAVFE